MGRSARVRFDRGELSGAFGDIGTDFPLIAGLILVAGLEASSVLVMFGLMQVASGLAYGIPMPAQPLKAMSVLVIAQGLDAEILYGGGLAIGLIMLVLAGSGLVDLMARVIPKPVVRGIQFGLGLQLSLLALGDYVPSEGGAGLLLAGVSFAIVIALIRNRRFPPALLVIALGVAWALIFRGFEPGGFGLALPDLRVPEWGHITQGLVLLALPQLPLSLANSVLASRQSVVDLYPDRDVSVRQIATSYGLMNLVNPFFGGIPTCHGSGGIVGHHLFGARTGGSVVIYGGFYLTIGLFLSSGFGNLVELFPLPALGVVLAFEGLALMRLIGDVRGRALAVALLVGVVAATLPYGYLVGAVVGAVLLRFPMFTATR